MFQLAAAIFAGADFRDDPAAQQRDGNIDAIRGIVRRVFYPHGSRELPRYFELADLSPRNSGVYAGFVHWTPLGPIADEARRVHRIGFPLRRIRVFALRESGRREPVLPAEVVPVVDVKS